MDELREDFKNWLKYENYKEATIKLYVRQLNRICKILYDKPNDWTRLVPDLAPLLICCIEYANKEYYISERNFELIKSHFEKLNHNLPNTDIDYIPDLTIASTIGNGETDLSTVRISEIEKYFELIDFVFKFKNDFKNADFDLIYTTCRINYDFVFETSYYDFLHLIYEQISNAKTFDQINFHFVYQKRSLFQYKRALFLLYKYISENPTSLSKSKSDSVIPDVSEFISYNKNFKNQIVELTIIGPLGNTPAHITTSPSDNPEGILGKQLTKRAFPVNSSRTIHKIDGLPTITPHGRYYNTDTINDYLDTKHFNVRNPYDGVDYELDYSENNWCNRSEALKILDISKAFLTKLTKNELLTHIKNTKRSTLYYVPELKQLQKLHDEIKNHFQKYCNSKYVNERFSEKLKKFQGIVKFK